MKFEDILKDLENKKYKPIYLLMGEEPYYIDALTNFVAKNVLPDAEKSFNQIILYGKDTDAATVINTAKRYPMMSGLQVVIVKEAQTMNDFDDLVYYVEAPLMSTILVINYKYKNYDQRKRLCKLIEEKGVVFISKKLYEDQVPVWITSYLKDRNISIELKASHLLPEFLGNDLSKIVNEIDKLILVLPSGVSHITAEHIERYVGISKDFNNFELTKSLAQTNILKANQIINHFSKNPNDNPLSLTIASLYYFFSRVLMYHFCKDKSPKNIASVLKVRPYFVTEYELAARNYSIPKVVNVISLLREYDLKSKGFNNFSTPEGELLKELVFKILH